MLLLTSTGSDRVRANVQAEGDATRVVRVSTDWPREAFFREFDRLLAESDFRNEYALAQAAGISHSTLSSWRSGRQRPSTKGLAAIARAFETVTSLELWELAGLVADGTTAKLGIPGASDPTTHRTPRRSPPELDELDELFSQLDDAGQQAIRTQLQMAITWAKSELSP